MYSKQEPEVGTWYVNRTGKLMKVKLVMYHHEEAERVMIEFLEGQLKVVSIDDWYFLELHKQIKLRNEAQYNQ